MGYWRTELKAEVEEVAALRFKNTNQDRDYRIKEQPPLNVNNNFFHQNRKESQKTCIS